MVSDNRGCPDPDKPPGDLTPNHEIIMAADTDTEDEDNNPYNDYEPLPTQETAEISEEDSSNEEGASGNDQSLPSITRIEETLVQEVWSSSVPEAVDIEMDSTKVDEVKQAMKDFTLPPSSIPDWANTIPEEQWKQQLMNRLQHQQSQP